MAALTEVPGFAGEIQKVIVPAGLASDAGETVVRIAAFDEALDRLLLHRTLKPPCGAQFLREASNALVKRARARRRREGVTNESGRYATAFPIFLIPLKGRHGSAGYGKQWNWTRLFALMAQKGHR